MAAIEHPNVFQCFAATAEQNANKVAVVFLGTTYTYGKLLDLVERMAAGLHSIGLGKGDHIVMYIPNSVQFIVTWRFL